MNPTFQAVLAAAISFLFVTFLFAILSLLCKTIRNCKNPRRTHQITANDSSSNPNHTSIIIEESGSFDPSLHQISMTELIIATRDFACDGIVGDGSFGLVYKARLSTGVTVAVKRLSNDAFQGFREFQAEMETLGMNQIRHPNLVRILGYCVSGDDRILIYEYIEKGSLDQWIHNTSLSLSTSSEDDVEAHIKPLGWETRVKIITGVAKGLSYLHTLETPIIHRDIKASNVLLDAKFEAHIADFGLARRVKPWHSHVSTQVAGTVGYMPPEYREGYMVATVKADVYSFGVLMIEIVTGKRPNLPIKMENGKDVGFVQWSRKMVAEGREMEMIDSSVSRDGLRELEVREFFKIACLCTSERSSERPSMAEVVTLLN